MKCLIEEIHFNDIPVSDLQISLEWYQKHLGFDLGFKNNSMGVLKLPNGPILVLNQSDSSGRAVWSNDGVTRPIIGFTTNEIEKLHGELRDAGIITTDIRDEGMGWFFEFEDPDGNMFSVLKYNQL
jgi:catechol 2,3-dioxygenase-like lactoylglutathione lyase family enzyme